MDRVSAWTSLCTLAGLYRHGTQAGGVAPTPITAGWLNAVQEELVSIVQAAGLTLNADDSTQVLEAIQHLISESGKVFLPLVGGELTGPLRATGGIRVQKGAPSSGNTSRVGYAFGSDGDSGLFTVGGTEGDGSDLALFIDGVELFRLKSSDGSLVLPNGLVLDGGRSPYHTGNHPAMLAVVYPVGSIYMNASVATNPATLLGFGTWVALGTGRMLISAGSGTDARGEERAFALGSTGGEYGHVLTIAEMPEHDHTVPQGVTAGPAGEYTSGDDMTSQVATNPASGPAGGGQAHNNMPPYLAVHMWRRTA
ncbi:phage tail protein [Pseudomonas sp. I2]|uniref:phage tail protein n=1 Tax=unclassified Pseudomonas TaxID=196821 RepID=UPI0034D3A532